MSKLCEDQSMSDLLDKIQSDDSNDVMYVEELLVSFPDDYRLHFMLGSILVEKQKPMEAHAALTRAVTLEPQFILARYQLGFFELTSGEADQALATWGPLLTLPKDNYFRVFVEGLTHLIRDEFQDAIIILQQGTELNEDNIPLNNDIRLLIEECKKLISDNTENSISDNLEDDSQSTTSLILNQFGSGNTKH